MPRVTSDSFRAAYLRLCEQHYAEKRAPMNAAKQADFDVGYLCYRQLLERLFALSTDSNVLDIPPYGMEYRALGFRFIYTEDCVTEVCAFGHAQLFGCSYIVGNQDELTETPTMFFIPNLCRSTIHALFNQSIIPHEPLA